jgi:uncharacterized protein (TIGR03000 family)
MISANRNGQGTKRKETNMLRRSIPVLSVFVLALTVVAVVAEDASAALGDRIFGGRLRGRFQGRRGYTTAAAPMTGEPLQQPQGAQQAMAAGQAEEQQQPQVVRTGLLGRRAYYVQPSQQQNVAGTVLLNLQVPASAKVWIEGQETQVTGTSRSFVSPRLNPGQYTYNVKAQWTENGKQVTRERKVQVRPNQTVRINLQQPSPEELRTQPKEERQD